MVGLKKNRSEADEAHLMEIRAASSNKTLYILDARPKTNAMANQAKGAGYENTQFYKNTVIEFLNIDHIHVMRDSHKRLQALCASPGELHQLMP